MNSTTYSKSIIAKMASKVNSTIADNLTIASIHNPTIASINNSESESSRKLCRAKHFRPSLSIVKPSPNPIQAKSCESIIKPNLVPPNVTGASQKLFNISKDSNQNMTIVVKKVYKNSTIFTILKMSIKQFRNSANPPSLIKKKIKIKKKSQNHKTSKKN